MGVPPSPALLYNVSNATNCPHFRVIISSISPLIKDCCTVMSAIIEKTFNENYSNKIRLRDVGSYIRGLTYSSDDVVESNGIFVCGLTILSTEARLIIIII